MWTGLYEIIPSENSRDRIVYATENLKIVERSWSANRVFHFRVRFNIKPKYWMIPGVVYNGNMLGSGRFPRPRFSSNWFFREDRCTLPSGVIIEDNKFVLSVFTEPAKTTDELSSVSIQNNIIVIRIPWMETPLRYTSKGKFTRGETTYFDEPTTYTRRFYIINAPYRELGYENGYSYVLRRAWEIFGRREAINREIVQRYIELKTRFALDVHYYEDGKVAGFLQFVMPNTPLCGSSISAGFTGKSMEMALALYRIYLLNGDERIKNIAFNVANFHCVGLLKSGLIYTDYSLARKKWYGYFPKKCRNINTRQVGETIYSLLRLYQIAKNKGEQKEKWLIISKKIGDFLVAKQCEDGSFYSWWTPTGVGLTRGGTNGAYAIWLLAELYRITQDQKYLKTTEKAIVYYIKQIIDNNRYWGDTLDADCIDKEAGHALLRACVLMYEITRNESYLDAAKRAAYYILSWMFFWDVPFDEKTILGKIKFRTFGWTAVSVENLHLDPYGLIMAPDFIKIFKYTGDRFWLDIAISMARPVLGFISKKPGQLGANKIFVGFQPEQIYHTDWTYNSLLNIVLNIFQCGCIDIKRLMRGKGFFANNVFWVVAGCLNAALDLAELMGIKLGKIVIRRSGGIRYRIFKAIRDFIARINPII